MDENLLATQVIRAATEVHKSLGPGLLEKAYEHCLFYELQQNGLYAERQKPFPIVYHEVELKFGYVIDILVENKVVIEVKAVDALNDVHLAQVLTYLKLNDFKLGLLLNFNVKLLKHGIRRVVNKL